MLSGNTKISIFYRNLWITFGVFLIFTLLFILYALSIKELARVKELRIQSHSLVDELRNTSIDLTQMARTYVITADPNYKANYQEILDIRNGKRSRSTHYEDMYWDLAVSDDQYPCESGTPPIALEERMNQAGFTSHELAKLSEALKLSDNLSHTEMAAMDLIKLNGPDVHERHRTASAMLYDMNYQKGKYAVMKSIGEFHSLMDKRTSDSVNRTEKAEIVLLILLFISGVCLLFMLWKIYRSLNLILGTSIIQLRRYIDQLGGEEFSSLTEAEKERKGSVLDWLSQVHIKLVNMDTERKEEAKKSERQKQLYSALSQCNQAIIHCTGESELFTRLCHDAVVFGGMKMVWIGLYEEESRQLIPTAFYGEGTDYLQGLVISVDANDPAGQGPSGTVFREDRPYWCQDFQNDPATAFWREQGIAFGWKASAALPLHRNGIVIGTFNLYAGETDVFDEISQAILIEMMNDIDYALNIFEYESAKKEIESNLLILSKAVEYSPNSIVITDTAGKIEYANGAFLESAGYALSEVIGQNPNILKSGMQDESYYKEMWQTIKRGEIWHGELANRKKDGLIYWEEMDIVPIVDDSGTITNFVAVKKNITEEKRLLNELIETNIILNNTADELQKREEKLLKVNENLTEIINEESIKIIEKEKILMQQSKMAAMGEMVGMIAHQWRQPLNAVSAAAIKMNLLNELGTLAPEMVNTTMKFIQDMSQKMSSTINDFMDFAKPNREKEPINIRDAVAAANKIIEAQIMARNIVLNIDIKEEMQIDGYKKELIHVILNILSNARDAFDNNTMAYKVIKVSAYEKSNDVFIEISDNAGGIDTAAIDRIFDPFFTTKSTEKGTGLGLYMSKKIIEEHFEGSIRAFNEDGYAVFKIQLPKFSLYDENYDNNEDYMI